MKKGLLCHSSGSILPLAAYPTLSARILTVADVYDVITSQRPYKAALSEDATRERLLIGSAASFDPMIVRAFLNLLDAQPDFTLPQRICPLPAPANLQVARA